MRDAHFIDIGNREGWGDSYPFRMGAIDRRQHLYCIGKSGTGKTTLLLNMITQDIAAGRGVGVIDPHGDLARDILNHVPRERTDDVVYFDGTAIDYPIGLNLLQNVRTDDRHRVASGVVSSLKSIWRDSWGPRMEFILYAAVAALLECTDSSMLGVLRMLSDEPYRRWVARQVNDPVVRWFWTEEFEQYDERFRREVVAPIQNKVGQLVMAPPMRNIFGQVRRKIDARFMMDHSRIFVANLSKGLLGDEKANLLGSILVTSFQLAAMGRADMPEDERRDFHLYIDEFPNFTTDSFASILSEARKYRLCLTLSHQHGGQMSEGLAASVFGNAGNMISFRVGERDAQILSREFGGRYNPDAFTALGNHHVIAKLLLDGKQSEPFMGRTWAPLMAQHDRGERLIRRSREKYATPRHVVEGRIDRWMRRRRF